MSTKLVTISPSTEATLSRRGFLAKLGILFNGLAATGARGANCAISLFFRFSRSR